MGEGHVYDWYDADGLSMTRRMASIATGTLTTPLILFIFDWLALKAFQFSAINKPA